MSRITISLSEKLETLVKGAAGAGSVSSFISGVLETELGKAGLCAEVSKIDDDYDNRFDQLVARLQAEKEVYERERAMNCYALGKNWPINNYVSYEAFLSVEESIKSYKDMARRHTIVEWDITKAEELEDLCCDVRNDDDAPKDQDDWLRFFTGLNDRFQEIKIEL